MASNRKVSFHDKVSYSEPSNPWASVKSDICGSDLSNLYRDSCEKHKTQPIESMIQHLEKINLNTPGRVPVLSLKEEDLTPNSCEALEEIFRRVQYRLIDVSNCGLDDASASALFDMIEYYEAANELDISENRNIKNPGWQSCISMIKKSHALKILSVRATPLTDTNATSLGKAMLGSSLHTIKLEHCCLAGRPISSLCTALKRNTVLKELWLAYNDLTYHDAYNIGLLLKSNFYIQILDVSNNFIQDSGVAYIVEALIEQSSHLNKPPDTQRPKNSFNSELSACLKSVQQTQIDLNQGLKDDDEVFKINSSLDKNIITDDEFNIKRKDDKMDNEIPVSNTKTGCVGRSKLDVLLTNLVEPENKTVQKACKDNENQLITIDEIPNNLSDISYTNNNNINNNNNNNINNNNNNNNENMDVMYVEDIIDMDKNPVTDINDIELKIIEEKDKIIIKNDDLISENVLTYSEYDKEESKQCFMETENNLTISSKNNNLLDKNNEILKNDEKLMDCCDIIEEIKSTDILSIDINENRSNDKEINIEKTDNNSGEKIDDRKDIIKYLDDNKIKLLPLSQQNLINHFNDESSVLNNSEIQNDYDLKLVDDILLTDGIKKPKLEIIYEHDTILTTSNDSDILEKSSESFEFLPGEILNSKKEVTPEIDENILIEKKEESSEKIIDINDIHIELKLTPVENPNEVNIKIQSDSDEKPITEEFIFDNPCISNILDQSFEKSNVSVSLNETTKSNCEYVKNVIKNEYFSTASNLPERSLSSDSLNSDTSLDSNDSKSSIKLTESKFAKNGTLERQTEKTFLPIDQPTSTPTGLQVLVFWNNQISRHSSKSFSDLLSKTNTLEILNVGRNVLSNDFLANIKPSLKSNSTLTNLGLQGTNLSCAGVKSLAEVIEFGGNSTLQRIDLRDNNIETHGLTALDEVLKSNKTVTRIDLDDNPHKTIETNGNSSTDHTRLVTNIRAQCMRNEKPPPEAEPIRTSSVKKVRAEFLKSRKISLTCQSVRPTTTCFDTAVQTKSQDRYLLDPNNKKSTGRLKSPLPSPSPSPVSSPTPSPSRSRFQVSRVPENSKPSLSPITPSSSTGSSPSSFSRFRVTAVVPIVNQETDSLLLSSSSVTAIPINTNVTNNKILITPSPNINTIVKSEPQKILNLSNNKIQQQEQTLEQSEHKNQQQELQATESARNNFICSSSFDSSDSEVKRYMDDSCSSLSSMDSIDRPQDFNTLHSSTDDSSASITTDIKTQKINLNSTFINDSLNFTASDSQDSFDSTIPLKIPKLGTNDDTLTNTSCLADGGGGGISAGSDKIKSSEKRVRKTSWIGATMGKNEDVAYPASIEKLLSLFTRSGSENQKKEPQVNTPPSSRGLLSWMTNPKKITEECEIIKQKSVLQQKSSDNNLIPQGQQIMVDNIPNEIQQQIKENISPDHTITSSSLANLNINIDIEPRVRFEVGGDDDDDDDDDDEEEEEESTVGETVSTTIIGSASESSRSNEQLRLNQSDSNQNGGKLGQIARDSMSILKGNSNDSQDSMRSLDFDPVD